jgi:hypothetical protein
MLIIVSVGSEVASHQSSNICTDQEAAAVDIHNIDVGMCTCEYLRVSGHEGQP